jgi:hypothetical protein
LLSQPAWQGKEAQLEGNEEKYYKCTLAGHGRAGGLALLTQLVPSLCFPARREDGWGRRWREAVPKQLGSTPEGGWMALRRGSTITATLADHT